MATGKNIRIQPAVAPRLPTAPALYEQRYQDQLNDILRLFFNQIGNAMIAVLGTNGGVYIECPNGLFYAIGDQSVNGANTATQIEFGETYLNNGVSVVDDTKITVATGGIYNFQFSGQLTSTDASTKEVWVWIARNGDDIGYSARKYMLSGAGSSLAIEWAFNIDVEADNYIEMVFASDSAAVELSATAPTSPHPGISSAVLAVNFIAPLPETLPTPPTP